MFNIPVISHNARLTSGSSGMMHLNALNGSSWWRPSDDNNSLTSCPPSYEEAVNNGPSFGLFNVNGGETTTHLHQTQHHHCHNQQNNNHLHFPQSHHRPNNRSGRPTRSVSSHSVSSHDQNGSDNNKTSSSGEVRLPSCDDNTAERLDRQEPQCERFSRISIVSSSGNSAPSVPVSNFASN
ncbi:hypothetical protein V1264_001272 [Littorina saxatilis]|uniref:Uncharacterized protein n=1 Tax=Littorina saxatilis TaxID=31220 RepID=A0AAN9GNM6_9CAEN